MINRNSITVLVVDDSPVVRKVLSNILSEDKRIREVYTAPSGDLALRKIAKLDPDVVTLDIEMPKSDGLVTLERIMKFSPRPVIMVSVFTHEGAEKTLRALELGAVDFIPKPSGQLSRDIVLIAAELREKVKAVAPLKNRWLSRTRRRPSPSIESTPPKRLSNVIRKTIKQPPVLDLVGIGASTGGTEAIRRVLTRLPGDFPYGIVIVQHMPAGFTKSFAERLDSLCDLEVKEASNRDMIRPGRVLLAPGDRHMMVRKGEAGNYVELENSPEVNGHRPSVDVLFDSIADAFGARAAGVLLTGMGRDGASGLRRLHEMGGITFAQNEKSCVVFGMPKAAISEGGVDIVASDLQIGEALCMAAKGNTAGLISKIPGRAKQANGSYRNQE